MTSFFPLAQPKNHPARTQVRHHLQDGGAEALIADDAVHAREQFLHLAHRLVDTREHRIHARLVLADEIRAVADIVAAILRWLDVEHCAGYHFPIG